MTSQLDDKPQAVASQLDIDTRAPASPGVLAIFGLLPAPGFWWSWRSCPANDSSSGSASPSPPWPSPSVWRDI